MYGFQRAEKLKDQCSIKQLFSSGNRFKLFPFLVNWQLCNSGSSCNCQVLITASHKNFPLATDRNYIKRITREAYRKNKHILTSQIGKTDAGMIFSLVYTGRKKPRLDETESKIILILQRLLDEYEKADR